jgi:HK97 family phage portal protein
MPSLLRRVITRARKSALYDRHPELEGRVHLYSGDGTGTRQRYSDRDNPYFYRINTWARVAIRKIAENIAPLPVRVIDGDGEPIAGHPLTRLLSEVNDTMAASDLWREWTTEMLLQGECGLELALDGRGQPLELWTRQSHQFNVRLESGGRRYRNIVGFFVDDNRGDPYLVPNDDFIHTKFYNPEEPLRGLSPMSAVRSGILIDEFAQAWTGDFFRNQARPDFAVVTPQGVTKTEKKRIEDTLAADHGRRRSHKPVILEEGLIDIKPLNLAPKDTLWLEQREKSSEEILAVYGVSPELAGLGNRTYENMPEAKKALWELTLVPLAGSRDDWLTEFFRRRGDLLPNESIATDLSGVEVLREDVGKKIEQAVKLIQNGTPPNLAYQTVGMDLVIDGGDVGYMPINMVPVGESPYLARTPEPPTNTEQAAAPRATKQVDPWEFGGDLHRKTWQRKQFRIAPFEKRMQRMLKKQFQRQQIEIGRALRDQNQLGHGDGLETKQTKMNVLQLFDLQQEKERFRATFQPLLLAALEAVGQEEMDGLGIEMAFDVDRPEVRGEMAAILGKFAEETNNTTFNELTDLFTEAEAQGETIPDMMERLSAYFEGRKSDYQTERIARTTMTAANSAGDEAAWSQSGVVKGSRWLTNIDGRERDAHREAHNQTVGLGQMFEVGGEMLAFPGDPAGSPGNIINCRCSRAAVLIGEDV